MKTFILISAATLLPALALAIAAARADEPQSGHHEHLMACAKACTACQLECDACFHHCKHLVSEGKKEHAPTVQTCVDCSEFCSLAAKLCARNSPFAVAACE